MSYILDALKKSDQQRQHTKAPTLQSTHAVPASPRARRIAVNIWLAIALVGIGLLIGWWRPWEREASAIAPPPSPLTSTPTPPSSPTPAVVAPLVKMPSAPAIQAHPSATNMGEIPASAQSVENATKAAEKTAASTFSTPVNAPVNTSVSPPASAPHSAPNPSSETPLLQQHELPPEVQQTLPSVIIAFHQYSSNPADSRVMINNSVLHAGNWVAPGLKLEQITANGVILSYQGYRFQRGVR